MLFCGLLTITFPINLFDAPVKLCNGSVTKLSLSTTGYKSVIFCLNFCSENSGAVGEIFPIKQVK